MPPTAVSPPATGERDAADHDRDRGSDAGEVGSSALAAFVRRHPSVVAFARAGWAAKGVVYLLTGVLAFAVAVQPYGGSGGEADPSGAVRTIAGQPFGTPLLGALAVGLFVYALWRVATVVLPADTDGRALVRRLGYAASAATYVALGVTAVSLAARSGSSAAGSGQDARVTGTTRSVMDWTGGRWLVGVVGIVVVGIGVHFLWKGVTGAFERDIEHRAVGPLRWDVLRFLGRVGWIGRGAVMGVIGVFLTRAAIRFDPREARGLDDSLRRLADQQLGVVLVVAVAVGLVAYGTFCIVTTPVRRLVAADAQVVTS